VWGLGFGLCGVGFGVQGLGSGVWGQGFGAWGFGFGGLGTLLEFWVLGLGFGYLLRFVVLDTRRFLSAVCGLWFMVSGLKVWGLGFRVQVLGLGFRVSGLGVGRVYGSDQLVGGLG